MTGLLLGMTVTVKAGDINAAEQTVVDYINQTFTIDGKKYQVSEDAKSKAYAKMSEDGTDYTRAQAKAAIRQANNRIDEGVSSGYLVEVTETKQESDGEETTTEEIPDSTTPTIEPTPNPGSSTDEADDTNTSPATDDDADIDTDTDADTDTDIDTDVDSSTESALIFSMYKPIAERDQAKVCALLQFYKKCYRVIGFVTLTIGIILIPFLEKLISGDYPSDINIYYLYLIYLLNTVVSYFMFAYKTSLLNACQRVDIVSNVAGATNIIKTILQCVFLLLTKDYYWFAMMIPCLTVVNNLLVNNITNKKYPEYQCKGKIDTRTLAQIKEKVSGLIFQKIGGVVLISVDSIVISSFLGLTLLGKYNNY